jgi:hypothetical protein
MPTLTIDTKTTDNVTGVQPTPTTWSSVPPGVSVEVPPVLTASQAYYWTHAWQQGEQEALAELRQGRGRVFTDPGDAIRWLLSADDD